MDQDYKKKKKLLIFVKHCLKFFKLWVADKLKQNLYFLRDFMKLKVIIS